MIKTVNSIRLEMIQLLQKQAELLAELNATKMEPEQIRKNAVTILSIHQEIDVYYAELLKPTNPPSSENSIA